MNQELKLSYCGQDLMITVIRSKLTLEDNLVPPENKIKSQKRVINDGWIYNTKSNEKHSKCLGSQKTHSVNLHKSHLTGQKKLSMIKRVQISIEGPCYTKVK